MKIPKEIAEKIKQANDINNEIVGWILENLDCEGMTFERYFWNVVPEPQGEEQCDGEYCDQATVGDSCDWFYGDYYWEMPNALYLKIPFECQEAN